MHCDDTGLLLLKGHKDTVITTKQRKAIFCLESGVITDDMTVEGFMGKTNQKKKKKKKILNKVRISSFRHGQLIFQGNI